MLWIGFLQGIYFFISPFFLLESYLCTLIYLKKKKKDCKRPNHCCALNSSHYIDFGDDCVALTQVTHRTHSCLCIPVNSLKHRHILWKLKTLDDSYDKSGKFHLGSRKQYLISRNWRTSLRFRLFILVCYDIKNKYENRRVSAGISAVEFCFLCFNIMH